MLFQLVMIKNGTIRCEINLCACLFFIMSRKLVDCRALHYFDVKNDIRLGNIFC